MRTTLYNVRFTGNAKRKHSPCSSPSAKLARGESSSALIHDLQKKAEEEAEAAAKAKEEAKARAEAEAKAEVRTTLPLY